jgi:hypothetical protein
MSAFHLLDYRVTLPPTVYSAIREPYRYVVKVAKATLMAMSEEMKSRENLPKY